MIRVPAAADEALAIGWATVELERAVRDLAHLVAPGAAFREAPSSVILGARCLVAPAAPADLAAPAAHPRSLRIVLLEPDTEGRLAATLARSGEGWAATWGSGPVVGTRRGGVSAPRPGPLGTEWLVLGGPVAGPHRLLIEVVPSPP